MQVSKLRPNFYIPVSQITAKKYCECLELRPNFCIPGSQITAENRFKSLKHPIVCQNSSKTNWFLYIASKSTKTDERQVLLPSRPLSPKSPKSYAREKIQADVMKWILFSSFMCGMFLKLLPHAYVDGNSVPTFIFKALPSKIFHAFVISIIFAFSGAYSSLLTRDKAKYAKYEKFSRFYSLVSMLFAIAILVYAVSLSCQKCKWWQHAIQKIASMSVVYWKS